MESINIWTESVDWLNIVVNMVIFVGVPLLGVALVQMGGAVAVRAFKALVAALRFMVDEPTDAIIIDLSEITGEDRVKLVEAIGKVLDTIGGLPEPTQETGTLAPEAVK